MYYRKNPELMRAEIYENVKQFMIKSLIRNAKKPDFEWEPYFVDSDNFPDIGGCHTIREKIPLYLRHNLHTIFNYDYLEQYHPEIFVSGPIVILYAGTVLLVTKAIVLENEVLIFDRGANLESLARRIEGHEDDDTDSLYDPDGENRILDKIVLHPRQVISVIQSAPDEWFDYEEQGRYCRGSQIYRTLLSKISVVVEQYGAYTTSLAAACGEGYVDNYLKPPQCLIFPNRHHDVISALFEDKQAARILSDSFDVSPVLTTAAIHYVYKEETTINYDEKTNYTAKDVSSILSYLPFLTEEKLLQHSTEEYITHELVYTGPKKRRRKDMDIDIFSSRHVESLIRFFRTKKQKVSRERTYPLLQRLLGKPPPSLILLFLIHAGALDLLGADNENDLERGDYLSADADADLSLPVCPLTEYYLALKTSRDPASFERGLQQRLKLILAGGYNFEYDFEGNFTSEQIARYRKAPFRLVADIIREGANLTRKSLRKPVPLTQPEQVPALPRGQKWYIPETDHDLISLGTHLHNCVGGYSHNVKDGNPFIGVMYPEIGKIEEGIAIFMSWDDTGHFVLKDTDAGVNGVHNRKPNEVEKKILMGWGMVSNSYEGIPTQIKSVRWEGNEIVPPWREVEKIPTRSNPRQTQPYTELPLDFLKHVYGW